MVCCWRALQRGALLGAATAGWPAFSCLLVLLPPLLLQFLLLLLPVGRRQRRAGGRAQRAGQRGGRARHGRRGELPPAGRPGQRRAALQLQLGVGIGLAHGLPQVHAPRGAEHAQVAAACAAGGWARAGLKGGWQRRSPCHGSAATPPVTAVPSPSALLSSIPGQHPPGAASSCSSPSPCSARSSPGSSTRHSQAPPGPAASCSWLRTLSSSTAADWAEPASEGGPPRRLGRGAGASGRLPLACSEGARPIPPPPLAPLRCEAAEVGRLPPCGGYSSLAAADEGRRCSEACSARWGPDLNPSSLGEGSAGAGEEPPEAHCTVTAGPADANGLAAAPARGGAAPRLRDASLPAGGGGGVVPPLAGGAAPAPPGSLMPPASAPACRAPRNECTFRRPREVCSGPVGRSWSDQQVIHGSQECLRACTERQAGGALAACPARCASMRKWLASPSLLGPCSLPGSPLYPSASPDACQGPSAAHPNAPRRRP